MNTTSQFTSNFWNIYIAVIVVLSFIGLAWLLLSQNVVKRPKKGEEVKTTGHEWDGIEEYNNPLPRWWFWLYVCTWTFGIGYLVMYPGVGDFKGIWGWTSHGQYEEEVAKAEQKYSQVYAKFAKMPIEKVAKDPEARAIGQNLFNTYCIQCHGSDAKGSKGFPNLTDDDWLWGGEPEKIQETIEKGRTAAMPAWGPALGEEGVKNVTQYVVWLWGGTQKAITETITNGRSSQMPAWGHFLDKDKLHLMTAYVWGLSNKDGKKAPAKKAEPAQAAPAAEASAPAADSAASAAPALDAKAAPAAEAKPEEASAKVDGKAVFEANCKTCHGGLIPGAPVVGKKEDWAPRIKQGKDTLHKHAIEGFNSMPAKGGNGSLSDDEVKAAVDFMANESGAKF